MSLSLQNKLIFVYMLVSICIARDAFDIAKNVNSINASKGMRCDIKMKISDKDNRESNLHMKSISKNNGEMQMLWVLSPASDRGVAMCKIDNKKKDEIRVYLPAFEKIKKISTKRRTESFMGSDISYEDMGQRNIDNFNYSLEADTTISGKDCYSLISRPLNKKNTSYSYHITYLEKSSYLPVYEISYNFNNTIKKTKRYEYVLIDSLYFIKNLYVENIENKNSTHLKIENIIIDDSIPDNAFNQSKLKRIPIE